MRRRLSIDHTVSIIRVILVVGAIAALLAVAAS
jgi:hypothetical protein